MYKIKFHKLGSSFEHSGVMGQKKGVRRYQNEDGSLTELGREHYGVGPPRDNEHSEYNDIRESNRQKVKSGKDAFKALPLKKTNGSTCKRL